MFSSSRFVMSHIAVYAIGEKFPTTGTKRKYSNVIYVLSSLKRSLALLARELLQVYRKILSLLDESCRNPQVTR
jgi:hypothetical protein